jgi:hypothetical protein
MLNVTGVFFQDGGVELMKFLCTTNGNPGDSSMCSIDTGVRMGTIAGADPVRAMQ